MRHGDEYFRKVRQRFGFQSASTYLLSLKKCKIMRMVRYGSGIFSFGSCAPFVAMLDLVRQHLEQETNLHESPFRIDLREFSQFDLYRVYGAWRFGGVRDGTTAIRMPVSKYVSSARARISNPVSGGQCHLNHLTILRRFSWPSLAYMCTKVA